VLNTTSSETYQEDTCSLFEMREQRHYGVSIAFHYILAAYCRLQTGLITEQTQRTPNPHRVAQLTGARLAVGSAIIHWL